RKLAVLAAAIALVFMLPAGPAKAQSVQTPLVVIDRTAVTLTYTPITGGTTNWSGALSYQYSPTWDVLVSFFSPPAPAVTAFRVGGRYHLRRLSRRPQCLPPVDSLGRSREPNNCMLGVGLGRAVSKG